MFDADAADGWNVCVDFGTAFSKAAVASVGAWERFTPEAVNPLPLGRRFNAENPFLLLSAVFVDDDRILFGEEAVRRGAELVDTMRQPLRSFKTLLGADDLERALSSQLPASVDPDHAFRRRDLIVLYLSYLLRALHQAIASSNIASEQIQLRYACPSWRDGRADTASFQVVVRLFDEAKIIGDKLGESLDAHGGVSKKAALDALALARQAVVSEASISGMVFEAPAAAACNFIGHAAKPLVVIDMGAGTTDIAALAPHDGGFVDLALARTTLGQAGDFIDRTLLNLIIERVPGSKSKSSQAKLWHVLSGSIREIKESLFERGRVAFPYAGRTVEIARRDLERHPDYKAFVGDVEQAYQHSLNVLIERAEADGEREICAIAVGGGAQAPLIQDAIKIKPSAATKIKISRFAATPPWAGAKELGPNFADLFPQLAIAMGGALAPSFYLAKYAKPAA